MRILQLIDSLRSGGAERMAVTYANALSRRTEGSFLCCTRLEGVQREHLLPEVGYLFLNKKHTLDLRAFLRLQNFIKKNRIDLIQAHSTSFFLAVLVKMSLPGLKLVWHDHYGKRAQQNQRPGILKPASMFFDGIITVNSSLREWAVDKLNTKEVRYIKNFLPQDMVKSKSGKSLETLKGYNIICVANLRPPKDHLNLLRTIHILSQTEAKINLHLIGKDEEDQYSEKIKTFIRNNKLEESVFIYGEQEEIAGMLKQADLGVLSSASEGLPVALLEYGRAGLPVVCTRVGECEEVISNAGKLVPPGDPEAMAEAIRLYFKNEQQSKKDAIAFNQRIMSEYSEEIIIPEVLGFFESILNNNSQ